MLCDLVLYPRWFNDTKWMVSLHDMHEISFICRWCCICLAEILKSAETNSIFLDLWSIWLYPYDCSSICLRHVTPSKTNDNGKTHNHFEAATPAGHVTGGYAKKHCTSPRRGCAQNSSSGVFGTSRGWKLRNCRWTLHTTLRSWIFPRSFVKKLTTCWFNVTFSYPSWRSLSLWKGHLTIPKRSLWITW